MEWPKLKNIIIIILISTNLFLGYAVWDTKHKDSLLAANAREDAIQLLYVNEITFDPAIIPQDITLRPMVVQRDTGAEQSLAQGLLGAGELYRESSGSGINKYENLAGSRLQFHANGEFSGAFVSGAYPLNNLSPGLHAQQLLDSVGIRAMVLSVREEGDATIVTLRQLHQGVPVLACEMTLIYRGGALVEIGSSKRLSGVPEVDSAAEAPITIPTAIMNFIINIHAMGDVGSEIVNIIPAYQAVPTPSGVMHLSAIWIIQTKQVDYYLDTTEGTLNRAPNRAQAGAA